jgi:guanylate kinase
MKRLVTIEPERELSRSWTTRPRRDGESSEAYNFVTDEEFEKMIQMGGFLEYAGVFGRYYGTPIPNAPKNLLEIDVQGALQIRERAISLGTLSKHLFAMIITNVPDVLSQRLFGRSDGTPELVKLKRFHAFFEKELPLARKLGAHVIVNDLLPRAEIDLIAAINGHYFCDPKLAEIIEAFEGYDLTPVRERISELEPVA